MLTYIQFSLHKFTYHVIAHFQLRLIPLKPTLGGLIAAGVEINSILGLISLRSAFIPLLT